MWNHIAYVVPYMEEHLWSSCFYVCPVTELAPAVRSDLSSRIIEFRDERPSHPTHYLPDDWILSTASLGMVHPFSPWIPNTSNYRNSCSLEAVHPILEQLWLSTHIFFYFVERISFELPVIGPVLPFGPKQNKHVSFLPTI